MMKEILNEYQRKKVKSTPPNITSQGMMEECDNMIQRDINVDETEINQDDLDGLIEEFPDITSPAMIDICENGDYF